MRIVKGQKVMTKKRESFWNADIQARYIDRVEQKEKKAVAKRNGEPVAENLEVVWAKLSQEEKHLIEYLFLSKKPSLVAFFDNGLFSGLMSKGLLKIPQGVSTVFIQSHQTTYTIPQAVWESLQDRYDLFPSLKDINKNNRIDDLSRQFEDQVEVLLSDSSSKAKI
jgi:hypothetical protein